MPSSKFIKFEFLPLKRIDFSTGRDIRIVF